MTPKKNGSKDNAVAKTASDTPKTGHGVNGNLRAGNPGNNGGGRQPSKIREICRRDFAEAAPILLEIAGNEDEKATDRVKAIEVLGKYGGVDKLALTLDEQPERELTPERLASLWEQLEQIKDIKQFERMLVAAATKQIEG